MKKALVYLMAVLLFLNSAMFVSADASIDSKVAALNKLTLLQGDGVSFNLSGKLKRSEAATFIVRILGKEAYVTANQQQYATSSFGDVKNTDWFAASVGYCVAEKIINGFPDGNYYPDEYVSEKAFFKLVLGALGYIEGTDFTWDTVYLFAYSVGLVSDAKYKTQTQDNTDFLREDVVTTLYQGLTIPLKGAKATIVDVLVNNHIIERKTAAELGLARDTIPTAIGSIQHVSDTELKIIWNEEIRALVFNQISVFETGNPATKLDVSIVKQTGTETVIQVAAQKADQDYSLEVLNVTDAEGNDNTSVKSSFKGYTPLKITSATAVNERKVTVEFNKQVKAVAADAIKLYESSAVSNAISAKIEEQTDHSITITTSLQKSDVPYTIQLAQVADDDGVVSSQTAQFKGYKIPEIKSDLFKVSKVVPVSKNVLNVYFTQPINGNIAFPAYYQILKNNQDYIGGSFTSMTIRALPTANNMISIYLKDHYISDDATYTLKISGDVASIYGVRLNAGATSTVAFHGSNEENLPFQIRNVFPVDSNTIALEFSREIDTVSAEQIGNYSVTSASGMPYGVLKTFVPSIGQGKFVHISLSGDLSKDSDYKVVVKNVNDIFNQTVITESTVGFAGQGIPSIRDLQIINITAADKSSLLVYFDREVDLMTAMNTSIYSIQGITDSGFYSSVANAYIDPASPYYVKLFLPAGKEVSNSSTYKLTVFNSIQDQNGNYPSVPIVYNFNGSADANVKPMITSAKIVGSDVVLVTLHKELTASGMNLSSSNYNLETKDGSNTVTIKTPLSVSLVNPTTLAIKFQDLDINKYYTLNVTSLADYSGVYTRTQADGFTSIPVTMGN